MKYLHSLQSYSSFCVMQILKMDDVINGYRIESNQNMKNISGKNGSRKLKLVTNIVP